MKKSTILCMVIIAVLLVVVGIKIITPKISGSAGNGKSHVIPAALEQLPLSQIRPSTNITIAKLQKPLRIDGFSCAAGWIHFSTEGRLKAFVLAETSEIQGNRIPKGSWIRLHPDQTLQFCSFPEETTIQGYVCDGGWGGSEGVSTSFYPSGKLASFYMPKNAVIQGIPCQAGSFRPIFLYENGNLKQCTLSQDADIGGRNVTAGQTVVLDEGGQVKSVASLSILGRARNWMLRLF
jgi:hypothetical protein